MRRQENDIATHFTQIAETRHRDVRRMQAQMAGSLFRGLSVAMRRVFRP